MKLFKTSRKKSEFFDIWKRLKRNKIAMFGVVMFTLIVLMTVFADIIVPYDRAIEQNAANRLQNPSVEHWFGTDSFGRDVFARIVHSSRNSVTLGIVTVAVGITIGGILASIAGFYGGKVDKWIVRAADTLMCIPFMLLALAIVAAIGASYNNVLIALMIAYVPSFTRVIRSTVLTVVGQDYIEAAKACGAPDYQIIVKHVLPNSIATIIVQATMSVGSVIIAAAALSYIGMGIQPPAPEWGSMLSESKSYMMSAPYLVLFPGLAITITALSLNLMGDGLRDALDPRLKD